MTLILFRADLQGCFLRSLLLNVELDILIQQIQKFIPAVKHGIKSSQSWLLLLLAKTRWRCQQFIAIFITKLLVNNKDWEAKGNKYFNVPKEKTAFGHNDNTLTF